MEICLVGELKSLLSFRPLQNSPFPKPSQPCQDSFSCSFAALAVTQSFSSSTCQAQLDYEFDPGVVEEVIVEDVVPVWTGTVAAGLNRKDRKQSNDGH